MLSENKGGHVQRIVLALITALTASSCTFYTGPVRLGSIGNSSSQVEKTAPPEVTGEVTLTFVRTFGDGAGLRSPWGLSFGVDGTLYVCDKDRSSIVRLDENGEEVARYSGSVSRTERLYSPIDVCSTAGMAIYVIDASDSRILRFDRNLKNIYVMFSKNSEKNRLFGTFVGLAFDKDSGDLYVTDHDTGSIIRIDMLGKSISSRGSFGTSRESFREPAGLDVSPDGAIYVADKGAGVVAVLDNFGAKMRYFGGGILKAPVDAAVLTSGDIAVADKDGVVVFSKDGKPLGFAGFKAERALMPRSIAANGDMLFVADALTGKILEFRVGRTK